MTRPSLPAVSQFLAAVAACALLPGCDGGGSGVTRVHFHMVSHTDCVEATVELDLEAADAVLARTPDGDPDCSLDEDNSGCTLNVVELDGGSRLFASLEDCTIEMESVLFGCAFVEVDVEKLDPGPRQDCSCQAKDDSCYSHGHCGLCATLDGEARDCEVCENELDDDGDGNADCDDPDCEFTMHCGFGRSTLPCSTTTIPTTTSTTSPPTTLPVGERRPSSATLGIRQDGAAAGASASGAPVARQSRPYGAGGSSYAMIPPVPPPTSPNGM